MATTTRIGSRYRRRPVSTLVTPTSYDLFYPPRRTHLRLRGGVDYVVRQGETFASLAQSLYGDSTQWWVLADMNPAIAYPLDLKPDDVIKLPRLPRGR